MTQADINIVGDFLGSGSFSMLSRTIVSTLIFNFNLNIKLINKPMTKINLEKESYFSQMLKMSNTLEPSIISLHISNPPFQPIKNTLNVLLNIHNTVNFNSQMLAAHEHFQYVLLNSFKQVEDLNKNTKYRKYIHMPYLVPTDYMNESVDKVNIINGTSDIFLNEYSSKPYIFYAEGCLHSRNNFEEVIRGYCDAFTDKDNVLLVLKALNTSRDPNDNSFTKNHLVDIKRRIKKPNLPKMILINESLSDTEYINLFNSIDCFVNVSKWDGLFSGMHHAVALNKEIITPDYGGYCDVANDSVAFTIPCVKEVQYNSVDRFCEPGDTWFETNARDYRVAFMKVYDIHLKGGEGFKKRRKARESLIKSIDSNYLCSNMLQFFLTVLQEHHKNNNVFKSIASKVEMQQNRNKGPITK